MSTDRSDTVYFRWLEASQKFDYFVAALCLALVSYLAGTLDALRLGIDAATVELASILSILGAGFCGLKRIEANVTLLGAMHRRLYLEESAGSLKGAAATGDVQLNIATGELWTPRESLQKAQTNQAAAGKTKHVEKKWGSKAQNWYRWRNRLLIGGLVALIGARVLAGYGF